MPNPSHLYANQIVGWATANTDEAAVDTSLYRSAAGVVRTPNSFTVDGTLTAATFVNTSVTAPLNITGSSATAFTVARTGTNYAFQVSTNTASSATGVQITAAAEGGGLAVAVISSGTNESLTIDAKGSGTVTINGTGTGNIISGTRHQVNNSGTAAYSATVQSVNLIDTDAVYLYNSNASATAVSLYFQTLAASSSIGRIVFVDSGATGVFAFQIRDGGSNCVEKFRVGNVASDFTNRATFSQGVDVASANDLTLGDDGNVFEITGATQINAITNTNWPSGSTITLLFSSTPTVKYNTAGGASTSIILLAGAVDFVASAGDTLALCLCEIGGVGAWREIGRAVI